jgi:hypothetical protein
MREGAHAVKLRLLHKSDPGYYLMPGNKGANY